MNIEVPVEHLADRQQRFMREGIWLGIVVACALLAAVKPSLPVIAASALYIPIICMAFWKLGESAGWIVALVTGLATGFSTLGSNDTPELGAIFVKMAAHVLAFVFTAWIVSKVRRSLADLHDRTGQDPLTDALSKEAFDVALQQAIVAAKENTSLLLLVLADLDDLALINHRFGRRHGDRVLIAFAQQARRSLGRAALVARTSGDRFAFLVTIESCASGERFAIGLQTSLSFVLTKDTGLVTCSMGGILVSPYDRRSLVSLMDRADQLVGTAKRSGKNAVELEWNEFNAMGLVPRHSSGAPRGVR